MNNAIKIDVEHSPGPWAILTPDAPSNECRIISRAGFFVASVPHVENAKIISLTPELLQALARLHDRMGLVIDDCAASPADVEAYNMAGSVLAKAGVL